MNLPDDLTWYGDGGAQVARHEDQILLRDSTKPEVPPLVFTTEEWIAFCEGVENGEFRF